MRATNLQIFEGARKYLTNPKNWARESLWTDGEGRNVEIGKAVCFCIDGALERAAYDIDKNDYRTNWEQRSLLGFESFNELYSWHDDMSTTHQDVLDLLDQAIHKLKS